MQYASVRFRYGCVCNSRCKAKHSSYVHHRHYINHKCKTPIINPRTGKSRRNQLQISPWGLDVIPAPLYWKLLLKRQHKLQKHSINANGKQSWCNEKPEDKKAKIAESKCDAYNIITEMTWSSLLILSFKGETLLCFIGWNGHDDVILMHIK